MNWWQRAFHGLRMRLGPPRMATDYADDVPETPMARTVYLIGEGPDPWIAGFLCPCGCSEFLQISLLPSGRPRWQASVHWDGTASLHPSVWRQKGCRSHFLLRRGRIEWA